MKQFFWRIVICVVPVVVSAIVVGLAYQHFINGEGGFKLGVDLVGGTILIYEIDPQKKPEHYQPDELAAALKRRIDPADLMNITIRPVSDTRVEIILPTGGAFQAALAEQSWQELLQKVTDKWPELSVEQFNEVSRGNRQELAARIDQLLREQSWKQFVARAEVQWPGLKDKKLGETLPPSPADAAALLGKQEPQADPKEIDAFVKRNYLLTPLTEIENFLTSNYRLGSGRRDPSGEQVQQIKELINKVGALEFRILANARDDRAAIEAAQQYFKDAQNDPKLKAELDKAARAGEPPPEPRPPDPAGFEVKRDDRELLGHFKYKWVELGRSERHQLGLNNTARDGESWQAAARAREQGLPLLLPGSQTLLYSRPCQNTQMSPEERARKEFEYFLLVREPENENKRITGKDLVNAKPDRDQTMQLSVAFELNTRGGDLFHEVTYANRPSGPAQGEFHRHLAIILDGQIMSAPRLQSAIHTRGQITGKFSPKEVDQLVSILRAGQLPATLKPNPVSENTMGPTLGADTIRAGTVSVLVAFLLVMAFMIVYYRFAGLVASLALLANLLLTVAFMVLVQATFTLPGLAGLVLMLGMAVDANVLIYERLREERERGASLALAIRNGYDRAFPTIIDTHLSCIFTAIVLYTVGNDQLKGFGVSLTVGLVISLFTSLYMTRLMFDIWQYKGWLHKLSMLRFLTRPNIDFMSIRYYFFTATVVLSLLGVGLFLVRGASGLNIDFTGGTAYGGQLSQPMSIGELRHALGEESQKEKLRVARVEEVPGSDNLQYLITYEGEKQPTRVALPNPPEGDTTEARIEDVARRASQLPDTSVEQMFLSTESDEPGKSRLFTVRTSEKAPELVQAIVTRLLGDQLKRIEMVLPPAEQVKEATTQEVTLKFLDHENRQPVFASPGQVTMLLGRELKAAGIQQPPHIRGVGKSEEGRYQQMLVSFSDPVPTEQLMAALNKTSTEFANRPQPERLENFDKQLASDTQARAMYAILASWGAVLLYLWFRFGNWTFGLAAVLCLIHDLCLTLGIIAGCHYLAGGWLGNLLLLQDFKIDLPCVAALLTLVGYSVNDTIVVFDRIREVRGKNPDLTPEMVNDSINQTLSRTILTSFTTWLVVIVLYIWGGEGVHLFSFVMVVGVLIGTYSSIYIASPLLLIFGEGKGARSRERRPEPEPEEQPEAPSEAETAPA